jgi:hypothetical protein
MVSPQVRHTMVGPLSGTKGERSMVEGLSYGTRYSAETGGSATGLSATNAWHGAAVGDDGYVRLIGAVARLSFRQNARNLDSIDRSIAMEVTMARDVTGQPKAVPATSLLALALGAAAFGAVAIGALAIGRLAVGRLVIKKARFGALEVDQLTVRKLRVFEHDTGRQHEQSDVRDKA